MPELLKDASGKKVSSTWKRAAPNLRHFHQTNSRAGRSQIERRPPGPQPPPICQGDFGLAALHMARSSPQQTDRQTEIQVFSPNWGYSVLFKGIKPREISTDMSQGISQGKSCQDQIDRPGNQSKLRGNHYSKGKNKEVNN